MKIDDLEDYTKGADDVIVAWGSNRPKWFGAAHLTPGREVEDE